MHGFNTKQFFSYTDFRENSYKHNIQILCTLAIPKADDKKLADRKKIIDRAMSFPMDEVLKKYSKEQSLPLEIAREHEREIKRFLILSVINPQTRYLMAGPMDEIWHMFILFTRKYREFCNSVAGYFIDHFPSVPGEKPQDMKDYVKLLEDYKIVFGEDPPPQFWPRPQKSRKDNAVQCGCGYCHYECILGGCELVVAKA